ncbi:hypothetical protein ACTUVN_002369 [Pseudomonas caspiana]
MSSAQSKTTFYPTKNKHSNIAFACFLCAQNLSFRKIGAAMRDQRTARLLYLIDECGKIGMPEGGRPVFLDWLTQRLDEEPSDLWDPLPGNLTMEKIIAEYPGKLNKGFEK